MTKQVIITEVGKKHFLYHGDANGARCNFIPGQGFQVALFLSDPRPAELHPKKIGLGLLIHQHAIFLVLKLGDGEAYVDMPYFHFTGRPLEQVPTGFGFDCSISICDESGICRSLGGRWLTNKFSNAFVEATHMRMDKNEFDVAVQGAYKKWPDAKQMFEAATVTEFGWENMA